ncbi:MAG: DNA mismatch repair endonuclease MutL, partial [Firmicutes bacterium]|nr:DNA mismatch repair endonuclease MutL [Bacillota bacterium]
MIKILEKSVADKIAAGEVIDRPVSIVKELVENALDSGADQITVEIREGGKSYIRVTDNGCGIEADDVETAFLRHATSKITTEKDLDSIGTLGFRGEALASICAVARVELITKTADAKTGRRVIVENSRTVENKPTGCPEGTTITVRDLFFNVPARHKFLATDASESRRIIDFLSRIALSYPDVRFNVINGSKTVFTTSGRGNVLSNIISIYGNDIGKDLIPVEEAAGGFTLKGFVSSPGTTLSSRSRQIFCVNGRIISSSVMERALDKAYRERLFSGRFPVAFLFLAMPPEKLDVNIHPTKKEVRFDDNAEVEDFVEMAVSQALKGKESIPAITAKPSVPVKMPEPEQFIEKKKPE